MSPRTAVLATTVLASALALSACGSSSSGDSSSSASGGASSASASGSSTTGDSFPVTIKHAFGETTIKAKPERVASLGWGNHEVPLALGVVPVGMSKATWGDDDKDGIMPWAQDKLKQLGGSTPVLFDDTDSIDYEAVANTKPDVILAAYSGITKEQYERLSKIAPVVAYPKQAWGTSMREMIEMDSEAMGRKADGIALADSLDKQITDIAAKHPTLKGKGALFTYIDTKDLSKIGFYNTSDPRAALLEKIGMTTPKAAAAANGKGSFFTTLSAEQGDQLSDAQMMVTYGSDQASILKTVQANPLWSKLAPVKNGAIAVLPDNTPLAAAANPSPLNIAWGLDKYLTLLDGAAAKVK